MTAAKTLTIPLSGRRPVEIDREDWPLIAEATHDDYQGQYEFQANWTDRGHLKVRHRGDTYVVYGRRVGDSQLQGDRNFRLVAGYVCQESEVPELIAKVAAEIDLESLASECLEDLPPERL